MTLPPEDHLAILNLIARYNHAIDFGSAEEYADCFTEDGEFDARPVVEAYGRDDLVEFAATVIVNGRQSLHWTSNALVEGDGAEAQVRVYLMNTNKGLDLHAGPTGVYDDVVVKTANGWRFRRRRLVFDEAPPWPPSVERP